MRLGNRIGHHTLEYIPNQIYEERPIASHRTHQGGISVSICYLWILHYMVICLVSPFSKLRCDKHLSLLPAFQESETH